MFVLFFIPKIRRSKDRRIRRMSYWKDLWSQNLLEKYNRLINRPPSNRQDLEEFMNDLKQIEEETIHASYNNVSLDHSFTWIWGVCQAYLDFISDIRSMSMEDYSTIRYSINSCSLGPDLWLDTIIFEIHSEFLLWLEEE